MTEDLNFGFSRILDSWARGQINTCMPGVVTEFSNRTVPQVSVQPGFKRFLESADAPENLPIIENVPVIYPGSSNYLMVYDIPVDTPVLLVFAQRSIGPWMQQGGSVDPALDHMFDLSDAIAIPGLIPFPDELSAAVIEDGISIQKRDGSSYISIEGDTITTNGDETVLQEGTDWAVQFTTLKSAFDTLKTDLNNLITIFNAHVHPGVTAGAASTAVSVTPGTPSAADMANSKVDDVRLP